MGTGFELSFSFGFDSILILQRFFLSRSIWADGSLKKQKPVRARRASGVSLLYFEWLFHYLFPCFANVIPGDEKGSSHLMRFHVFRTHLDPGGHRIMFLFF